MVHFRRKWTSNASGKFGNEVKLCFLGWDDEVFADAGECFFPELGVQGFLLRCLQVLIDEVLCTCQLAFSLCRRMLLTIIRISAPSKTDLPRCKLSGVWIDKDRHKTGLCAIFVNDLHDLLGFAPIYVSVRDVGKIFHLQL